jgi:hypothetical protein
LGGHAGDNDFLCLATSLASALQQTVDAAILLRDESQVRIELQNLLNRTAAEKLKVGKSEVKEGDGRVHYDREIRAVLAKTAKGVPVPDLYEIIVRASWRSAGQDTYVRHGELVTNMLRTH